MAPFSPRGAGCWVSFGRLREGVQLLSGPRSWSNERGERSFLVPRDLATHYPSIKCLRLASGAPEEHNVRLRPVDSVVHPPPRLLDPEATPLGLRGNFPLATPRCARGWAGCRGVWLEGILAHLRE